MYKAIRLIYVVYSILSYTGQTLIDSAPVVSLQRDTVIISRLSLNNEMLFIEKKCILWLTYVHFIRSDAVQLSHDLT